MQMITTFITIIIYKRSKIKITKQPWLKTKYKKAELTVLVRLLRTFNLPTSYYAASLSSSVSTTSWLSKYSKAASDALAPSPIEITICL